LVDESKRADNDDVHGMVATSMVATISGRRALAIAVATRWEVIARAAIVVAAFVFTCLVTAVAVQAHPKVGGAQVPATASIRACSGHHLCIACMNNVVNGVSS